MRAVRRHKDSPWVLLYLERWLRAPVSMPNGDLVDRESGTPQGAVVSPVLANLFLQLCVRSLDATGVSDHPV
jgi:RNA-directed DNA polymerase